MGKTVSFAYRKRKDPSMFFFRFVFVGITLFVEVSCWFGLLRVSFPPAYKQALVDTVNLPRCSASMVVFFYFHTL